MSKNNMIKVLIKNPGRPARMVEIDNTLETLQGLVGGYIEVVLPERNNEGILMIVNEEGKLRRMEANFALGDDLIVGTAIFIGEDGEEFRGLTEHEAGLARGYILGPQHRMDAEMKQWNDFIHETIEKHGGDEE